MKQPSLANAELAVMDLLWRNDDPMTARQILEQLYPDAAKPQHGTVQRLLQRLEDKGYIERDDDYDRHGQLVRREHIHSGGRSSTIMEYVYDAAGNLLHHDTFVSQYAPRRAAYHYGPGYEPPEEEEEEEIP